MALQQASPKKIYIRVDDGPQTQYTISNMPANNSNVYVSVAQNGYTIRSVTFEGSYTLASGNTGRYLYARISGSNNTTNRYGISFGSDGYSGLTGRLNGANDQDFHTFSSDYGTHTYKVTIGRSSATIIYDNSEYTFTYTTEESNIVNTIMNSSTMNVYGSRYNSRVTASDIDVEVTYS